MKNRLYKTIVEKILSLIHEGIFPPGSRLPGERELAERFGVSRVTIREAEIALEALGHIIIKTGSGAYVQDLGENSPGALPDVTAFELTAARAVIEAEAAALAAANMTDEGIKHLESLIKAMSAVHPNGRDEGDDIDRQFHLSIAKMSCNPVVEYTIEQLWRIRNELPQVQKVYSSVCVTDAKARTDEHASIYAALRDRDPAAARFAMREHFQRLFEAMLVATETSAFEEVKRKIGEDRKRFMVTTQI
ncbi:GntR family transcriptional regulator [Sphingorhabdus lutea]|uniref:GntR family transcriptional regulator n=1 Tax=Sphingorhabdus lutea TaxID=1913578 RepID=A0A1L3J8T0_9SPHN|nr:FadR/GntR family transcriptional regulator [Sphingorhabdus lutea]APG61546.1 GntR family transcriptional regulator [Sphingorhabdus lutea]